MSMLILAGVISMICHHFFYLLLSGRTVNTDRVVMLEISRQVLVGAAGNAIASFATFVLGTAVGIAFVQILWTRLHRKPYAIEHIEAMISCRSSPFSPAALRSWRAAWLLSAIAALGSTMRLITIFAPGALRTETSSFEKTCTIQKMDLSHAVFGVAIPDAQNVPIFYPSPNLDRMVLQNIVSGSYIPPPNFCGTCSYNVSFNAPAMSCTDITSQFNFNTMFLKDSDPIIWKVTHDIGLRGSTITVATMKAQNVQMEAARCTVYNATYLAEISHNATSTNVIVGNPTLHRPVNETQQDAPDYMSLFTTALATAQFLDGFGQVDLLKMQYINRGAGPYANIYFNPYFIFSSLGRPGPQSSMTWEWDSMRDAFPQLMANISISLLSNPINAPTSNYDTLCTYSTVLYVYDQLHLLLSYGLGILLASLCVGAGFWSIRRNGREETLEFSRLMVAILSPSLLHEELRKSVRLKTKQDGPDGCSTFVVDSDHYEP